MSSAALQAYEALQQQTDRMTARLEARYQSHLNCRAGCSHCCQHHLSVFPVEAAVVKTAIENLPLITRQMLQAQAVEALQKTATDEVSACPLLLNDRCSIYQARPLICRTQGLPLLYAAEDGEEEVDYCPLNFTAENAIDDLDENYLVPLDTLNLKLAAINLQYCQEQGVETSASLTRLSIAEILCSIPASLDSKAGNDD